MKDEFLTPGRTKHLRWLLIVIIVLAALLGLLAVLVMVQSGVSTGVVLLGIAAVIGTSAVLARNAVWSYAPNAKRLCVLTAVLTVLFSLPLALAGPFGLVSVVVGLGLLFVTLMGERQPR